MHTCEVGVPNTPTLHCLVSTSVARVDSVQRHSVHSLGFRAGRSRWACILGFAVPSFFLHTRYRFAGYPLWLGVTELCRLWATLSYRLDIVGTDCELSELRGRNKIHELEQMKSDVPYDIHFPNKKRTRTSYLNPRRKSLRVGRATCCYSQM